MSTRRYPQADIHINPDDYVEVRLQNSVLPGERTLYVDVNGVTVLRIGNLPRIPLRRRLPIPFELPLTGAKE
jgi:hypothetical protein